MNRTTETSDAAAMHGRVPDRPPVVRFLVLFAGLLALALGLSALSASVVPADTSPPLTGESQAKTNTDEGVKGRQSL